MFCGLLHRARLCAGETTSSRLWLLPRRPRRNRNEPALASERPCHFRILHAWLLRFFITTGLKPHPNKRTMNYPGQVAPPPLRENTLADAPKNRCGGRVRFR